MKVLVLGGTGAMGVPLVEILHQEPDNVIYITSRKKHASKENLIYIEGNAQDDGFLKKLLQEKYDVIIDFLSYTPDEFKRRMNTLLNSTKQYFFLSSCRVFAEKEQPITEDSPRLIDVCNEKEYLCTDEYALAKAREENMLFTSPYKNWTVVRPYITFNSERIQLGAYEKEYWLYRALKGRSIVFSKEIAYHTTTLSYGVDVARMIACLIGNPAAMGEAFNVVRGVPLKWENILNIYINTIEKCLQIRPKVCWEPMVEWSEDLINNHWQVKYDRLYDRVFDIEKCNMILQEKYNAYETEKILEENLKQFIENGCCFKEINWKFEARADRLAHEHTPLKEIGCVKDKIKYLIWRYTNYGFKKDRYQR